MEITGSPGAEAALAPLVEAVLGTHDDSQPPDEVALEARALMWTITHSSAEAYSIATYAALTSQRLARSVTLARQSGDDAALLDALELTVASLGVTFDLESAVSAAAEGLALATRIDDQAAIARFEVFAGMAQSLQGDQAGFARWLRSAYERGSRVGDEVSTVYSATVLRSFPSEEQGPFVLPPLEELLERAERLRQPLLIMHVLAALIARDLAVDDVAGATRALGRTLLVAESQERTWPLATVGPLMTLVPLAVARGDLDNAVRLAESLAPIENLLPQILPIHVPRYREAVRQLREVVPPERYEELAAEVAGATLPRANRIAQSVVRSWTPPPLRDPVPSAERAETQATTQAPEPLTPREREVLLELTTGATNREIGEALGMAPKTVMHHTAAIYRKLGVRGRAEAVAWAYRNGVTAPPD
jgi:DNA-binding CsgD family transcriptional regulator